MPMSTVRWIVTMAASLSPMLAQAEVRAVQTPNASIGTVTDLGNGVGLQSDPHGREDVLILPHEPSAPLPPGPHGDVNQRAVTPFGSPLPPNHLTPAPVLPFRPNSPLMPPPSGPPASTPGSASGGGRLGR